MGLDFEGSEARWSYIGFNRFRERLAFAIGLELEDLEGFGGTIKPAQVKDDIKWLLFHSDCDGQISARRCAKVAPRIREIVACWDADYDKEQALLLAQGMESCAKHGKPLIFT